MDMQTLGVCPECGSEDLKVRTFTYFSSFTCLDCECCEEYDNTAPTKIQKSVGFSNQYNYQPKAKAIYERGIGNIPQGYEIHHIDCNPSNNALNNLIALPKGIHELVHLELHNFPNKQSFRNAFPDLDI